MRGSPRRTWAAARRVVEVWCLGPLHVPKLSPKLGLGPKKLGSCFMPLSLVFLIRSSIHFNTMRLVHLYPRQAETYHSMYSIRLDPQALCQLNQSMAQDPSRVPGAMNSPRNPRRNVNYKDGFDSR